MNLRRSGRLFVKAASALALTGLVSTGVSAQMLIPSIINAGVGTLNNAVGRVFAGAKQPKDIEAERASFMAKTQSQLSNLDPTVRDRFLASIEQQWERIENALLLENAQIARGKNAPVVDPTAMLGGLAAGAAGSMAMNLNVFGGSNFDSYASSAALNGVVSGLSGQQPGSAAPIARPYVTTLPSSNVPAMAQGAIASSATSAVSGGIADGVRSLVGSIKGATASSKLNESAHPLKFFGQHPQQLDRASVRREASMIGLKRIEKRANAPHDVFTPVIPDPDDGYTAMVFTYDAAGAVTSAMRVLKGNMVEFAQYSSDATGLIGEAPAPSNSNVTLRNVWSNGAFLAADEQAMTLGWSRQAAGLYASATSRGAGQ